MQIQKYREGACPMTFATMRAIITTLFKQYYTEFNRIINNFSCDILPTSKHRRSWERHRQRVPMESAVLEYPIMRKQTFSHSAQKSNSRICLQPRCSQQFLRAHSPSFCNRRRSKAEYLWRITQRWRCFSLCLLCPCFLAMVSPDRSRISFKSNW